MWRTFASRVEMSLYAASRAGKIAVPPPGAIEPICAWVATGSSRNAVGTTQRGVSSNEITPS